MKYCSLGSCDDHIFSAACNGKIRRLECPRYVTIHDRETNTSKREEKSQRESGEKGKGGGKMKKQEKLLRLRTILALSLIKEQAEEQIIEFLNNKIKKEEKEVKEHE